MGLVILAFVGGYSIYQWGLSQLDPTLEEEALLQELKPPEPKEQEEGGAEQRPLQRQQKGRPMLAVWQARGKNLVQRGSVLVGGVLAGGDLFRRALNVTIGHGLRQIVRAFIPNWDALVAKIPAIFGTVARWAMAPIVWVGLFFLNPVSRLSLFLVSLKWLWSFGSGLIGGGGEALLPLVEPMVQTAQSFFAMPAGCSFTVHFVEKNLKILTASFLFGGITLHFKGLFVEEKQFFACVWVSCFTISILVVLNDHSYLIFFIQKIFLKFPKIQGLIEEPLGFVSIVFGSGVLLQYFNRPDFPHS